MPRRVDIFFHPLSQTSTLSCTMKFSSIALGTVAAVAMLTGADASCSKATFNAMVAKAEGRGYRIPSRKCMAQVYERSCTECGNSFSCYAQKGKVLSRSIPACNARQRRLRRGRLYDEDDLGGGSFFVEGGANGGGQNGGPAWNVNARYERNWDQDDYVGDCIDDDWHLHRYCDGWLREKPGTKWWQK